MTASRRSRSPRLLLIATVVLAVTGLVLLEMPTGSPQSSAPAVTAEASRPAATSPSRQRGPSETVTTAAATPTQSALASQLPPHGEGVAGDRIIQQSLEAAWPADLPARDDAQLVAAGRSLLTADATGIGRSKWPQVFGNQDQAIAPAFSRLRVQAAIARRDQKPDRAVVHLVWAGADRGGTYTDRRITDWYFTRTSTKGSTTWTPQPHP
ncbi:hypothetical protein F7R91_33610 [Streptomyces luteolifulvus]|uniref:Uncharacterized protein n=1 Tax=Streptomyces luteolifulvus TaxID=2615112 RepID=A0A6H9US44_9ACTN|nr:hypothetical protein [Streptomyces luteolifulvus]KAB1141146.1 hypothetical protein F7R91_33610 [Streptomyces luteolifulvus]